MITEREAMMRFSVLILVICLITCLAVLNQFPR